MKSVCTHIKLVIVELRFIYFFYQFFAVSLALLRIVLHLQTIQNDASAIHLLNLNHLLNAQNWFFCCGRFSFISSLRLNQIYVRILLWRYETKYWRNKSFFSSSNQTFLASMQWQFSFIIPVFWSNSIIFHRWMLKSMNFTIISCRWFPIIHVKQTTCSILMIFYPFESEKNGSEKENEKIELFDIIASQSCVQRYVIPGAIVVVNLFQLSLRS